MQPALSTSKSCHGSVSITAAGLCTQRSVAHWQDQGHGSRQPAQRGTGCRAGTATRQQALRPACPAAWGLGAGGPCTPMNGMSVPWHGSAPRSDCGSPHASPPCVPRSLGPRRPTLMGFGASSLRVPGLSAIAQLGVTEAILASATSRELLGTGGVSTAPSPRCFASRREQVSLLGAQQRCLPQGERAAGRHTWLAAPARAVAAVTREMGTHGQAPASLITARRWAWGQAAAGTRQGGHVSSNNTALTHLQFTPSPTSPRGSPAPGLCAGGRWAAPVPWAVFASSEAKGLRESPPGQARLQGRGLFLLLVKDQRQRLKFSWSLAWSRRVMGDWGPGQCLHL